jgi:hypothetical protein
MMIETRGDGGDVKYVEDGLRGGRLKTAEAEEVSYSGTNRNVFGPWRLGIEQYNGGKAFVFSKQTCWHKELCSGWLKVEKEVLDWGSELERRQGE